MKLQNGDLVMLVGKCNEFGLIDNWYKDIAKTKEELIENLKAFYKNTLWEERVYDVHIYKIIVENNGYVHLEKNPIFKDTTKNFWGK